MSAEVARVSGSLVELEGLTGVAMYDVVLLGERQLPGEVVAITDRRITVQAYEDTGGLAPGAPVVSRGAPLSAELGPGLLGSVFDGLLRPLSETGTWLVPGGARKAGTDRRWQFTPSVAEGALVAEGDELGSIGGDTALPLRILVPAGTAGVVELIAAAGSYAADEVAATVAGVDVRLTSVWPVRRPRPYRERLNAAEGLYTGQRVLDLLYPVARGSSAAVPGGFGTGKTMLLQQIAKWCDADVIVYVGCGERGNEMADVRRRAERARGPSYRRPARPPHGDHREHLEHADDGA